MNFKNAVEYIYFEAEHFQFDRELGEVIDEEDAAEKGRYVLLNGRGQEYMDWLEKEPDHDPNVEYVRRRPSVEAIYYEDYDIWYVYPTSPSWSPVNGDGPGFDSWSEGPTYMFSRGRDGKVLGSMECNMSIYG